MPPAFFAVVIFEKGFHFLPALARTVIFLFMLVMVFGMTGRHHHTQLFLLSWSLECFARAGLEAQSS
jgi:hypothetical protein